MGEGSKIQWTDDTLNFWRGCDKISPGCAHCYITTTPIFKFTKLKHGDPRVRRDPETSRREALKWNKKPWVCPICGHCMTEEQSQGYRGCPTGFHAAQHHRRRVFSLSLGDWLDDKVPIEWLADALAVIRDTPELTWQLVTKRIV